MAGFILVSTVAKRNQTLEAERRKQSEPKALETVSPSLPQLYETCVKCSSCKGHGCQDCDGYGFLEPLKKAETLKPPKVKHLTVSDRIKQARGEVISPPVDLRLPNYLRLDDLKEGKGIYKRAWNLLKWISRNLFEGFGGTYFKKDEIRVNFPYFYVPLKILHERGFLGREQPKELYYLNPEAVSILREAFPKIVDDLIKASPGESWYDIVDKPTILEECLNCKGRGVLMSPKVRGVSKSWSACPECQGLGRTTVTKLAPTDPKHNEPDLNKEPSSLEPELAPEPPPPVRKVLLSEGSLRARLLKKCRKARIGGHWHYQGWNGTTPLFSVNGQQLSVLEAVWKLFKDQPLHPDFEPVRSCGIYNCAAPDHLIQVPSELARNFKKVGVELIREVRRLDDLGKGSAEIVQILDHKVSPATVYQIQKNLKYWNIS